MDLELRCNNLRCRVPLQQQQQQQQHHDHRNASATGSTTACVTTCSHIFCMSCANESFSRALVCPACGSALSASEDVFCVELNPTEDFKGSVLSGLRPELIMEICQRAMSFWVYQVTQEHAYQQLIQKKLEDKTSQLDTQLQTLITQANAEIQLLQEKLAASEKETESEKRRNIELGDAYADKGRQLQKLQLLYEKLKRKTIQTGSSLSLPEESSGDHNLAPFIRHRPYLLKPSRSTPSNQSTHGMNDLYEAPRAAAHLQRSHKGTLVIPPAPSPRFLPSHSFFAPGVASRNMSASHGHQLSTKASSSSQSSRRPSSIQSFVSRTSR